MATSFRKMYTEKDPLIVGATAPSLMEHHNFIYSEYLELPVIF
jgi:hypothetical protein